MELTHEDIQKLHKKVREWKKLKQGDSDYIERGGQEYEIINSENSATEAIGTYIKEHYSGVSKIEFSPIFIEGGKNNPPLSADVVPVVYDEEGN